MSLSHFTAALLFSLITSVVFAITSRDTNRSRVFYGLWVFAAFVIISLALSWLMFLGQR